MKSNRFTIVTRLCFGSVLLLLLVDSAHPQSANVKYGIGKNKKEVVEMSNMKGVVSDMECWHKPEVVIGVIMKRSYEEDEMTIASFILKSAGDKRKAININQEQIAGRYSVSNLASLLTIGKKVKVWLYDCNGGGSGTFAYADRVKWVF